MKKFFLFLLTLISCVSMMAESVTLTFIRTGNGNDPDNQQVRVIAKDANGNKLEGVTATITCSANYMNNRADNRYYFLTPNITTTNEEGITFYMTVSGVNMTVRQLNIDTYAVSTYGIARANDNAAAVNITAEVGEAMATLENVGVVTGGQAGINGNAHRVHSVQFTDGVAVSGDTQMGFAITPANSTAVYMSLYSITLSDGKLTNVSELLNTSTYTISGLEGTYAILTSPKGNHYLYDVTNDAFYGGKCAPVSIEVVDGKWNISQNGTTIVRGADVTTQSTAFVDTDQQAAIYNVENVVVSFNYQFTYNGKAWGTKEVSGIVGQDYPALTLPMGVSAEAPEGKITGEETTVEIPVALNGELPFQFVEEDDYEDIGSIEQFYYVKIGAGFYLKHADNQESMDISGNTSLDRSEKEVYSFGFVGNPFTGFKIVNYAAGDGYILSSAKDANDGSTGGATYLVMKQESSLTEADATHFVALKSTNYEGGFYLANEAGHRANYRKPYLAYWTGGADGGSTFRVEESSVGLEPAEFWTARDNALEVLNTMMMLPALYDAETVAAKFAEAEGTVYNQGDDVDALIARLEALPADIYSQASGHMIALSNSQQMNNTSYMRAQHDEASDTELVGSSYMLGADCVFMLNHVGNGAYTLYNPFKKLYIGIPDDLNEEVTEPSTAIANQSTNFCYMVENASDAATFTFTANSQNLVTLAAINMEGDYADYNGLALYQNGTVGNWLPSNSLCSWAVESVTEAAYNEMVENGSKSYEELYYPQEGKLYYLWNDNDSPLYFYNKGNGALGVAVAPTEGHPAFLWRIGRVEEEVCQTIGYHTAGDHYNGYSFQSVADDMYWSWKSLREEPYGFEILHDNAFVNGAFNLYGNGYIAQEGRFVALVIKNNGSLDQATYAAFNKTSTDYSSDYFCTEFTGTVLTDQAIAYLNLQEKIESCSSFTVGDGLGEYDDFDNQFTNALNAAKALPADATIVDIEAAMEAIDAASDALTLNMPAPGFYRFKGGYYDQYINMDYYVSYKVLCYPDDYDATDPGTVIYYTGEEILGYKNGLGIQSTYLLGDAYNEEAVDIVPSTVSYGKYSLWSNFEGSKSVWGWTDGYLNRSSGQAAPYSDWTIEAVEELPVTFDSEGWSDIYTPVALTIPEGVSAYTATVSDGNLAATQITGVIPANTAVILFSKQAGQTVWLPITDETGSSVGDNDLQGNVKTMPYDENVFVPAAGKVARQWEEIPGFRAYIVSESISTDDGGDVNGVDAIETIKEAILKSIYFDLNGRNLGTERPTRKGIYVINGRKVSIK